MPRAAPAVPLTARIRPETMAKLDEFLERRRAAGAELTRTEVVEVALRRFLAPQAHATKQRTAEIRG